MSVHSSYLTMAQPQVVRVVQVQVRVVQVQSECMMHRQQRTMQKGEGKGVQR